MPEELLSCKKNADSAVVALLFPNASRTLSNAVQLLWHTPSYSLSLFIKKCITEHYLSITVCTVMLVVLLAFKWQDAVKSAICSEIKHAHKINIMCAI